jgi:hypothetical protein
MTFKFTRWSVNCIPCMVYSRGMLLPRFVCLPVCMSVGVHLRVSICEEGDPNKLLPKLWTLSLSCGVWVRPWSQIWVLYDVLICLFKIYWNKDLSDFCCFQYHRWNRLTNRTKPAFNSLDEMGWQAELIYIGCVIQCKWNWITLRVNLYCLCYTV